ncbi:MAG: RNA methyltransferase, partial [Proteobacteria bacterium]|nr:RNA methyltransferase [Pseudomonadota bacterium]
KKHLDRASNIIKKYCLDIECIYLESSAEISKITGLNQAVTQGIVLETKQIIQQHWKDVIEQRKNKNGKDTVVILDQVTDVQNIGTIIRTSLAFSVDTIFVIDRNAPKESGALVKAACGAFENVSMISVPNIVQVMMKLQDLKYWIIGLDSAAKESILSKNMEFDKVALVFGSEGKGMRHLTRECCDLLLKINTSDAMQSINVASAVSIALYSRSAVMH